MSKSINQVDILGYIAGTFLVISIIPQVYKIIKTKQGQGISIPAYLLSSTAQILFIVYGFLINDYKIALTNIITIILTIIILTFVVYYEIRDRNLIIV